MTAALVLVLALASSSSGEVRVGSKAFTEGVILGEIGAQAVAAAGLHVEHKRQIGGTRLVYDALVSGDIDAYAEYTGTLKQEIFAGKVHDDDELAQALADQGLRETAPLGFQDTYGLVMREDEAARLGVVRISDLARHPELAFGLSNELLDRKDGWPSLSARYGLRPASVRGLDHDVAYRALAGGKIDVTDCYTTDADIARDHLRVLADDLHHFTRYDAVYLYRADLPPRAAAALGALAGRISESEMSAMNARASIDHVPEREVARDFLAKHVGVTGQARAATRTERLLQRTREHLALVAAALLFSLVVGLPLGVLAAKKRRVGQGVLGVVGIVQTVPSLALLVLFVPLVGIGSAPAVIAMVLYGLLPIVRNTHAGLTGISPPLKESALALGLSPAARLLQVELPLASPAILAGIQTSATIGVGTATIGALVGAGGYGQSILTGIRLDDVGLILEGALPAAAMAVAVQLAFVVVERLMVPRALRG